MTVDEKGLEAAAKAICQYENGSDCYGEAGKHALNDYRKMARAAITAYLSAKSAEPVAPVWQIEGTAAKRTSENAIVEAYARGRADAEAAAIRRGSGE